MFHSSTFIRTLPYPAIDVVRSTLIDAGISGGDLENGLDSRLHDLSDSVDLPNLIKRISSMFDLCEECETLTLVDDMHGIVDGSPVCGTCAL